MMHADTRSPDLAGPDDLADARARADAAQRDARTVLAAATALANALPPGRSEAALDRLEIAVGRGIARLERAMADKVAPLARRAADISDAMERRSAEEEREARTKYAGCPRHAVRLLAGTAAMDIAEATHALREAELAAAAHAEASWRAIAADVAAAV